MEQVFPLLPLFLCEFLCVGRHASEACGQLLCWPLNSNRALPRLPKPRLAGGEVNSDPDLASWLCWYVLHSFSSILISLSWFYWSFHCWAVLHLLNTTKRFTCGNMAPIRHWKFNPLFLHLSPAYVFVLMFPFLCWVPFFSFPIGNTICTGLHKNDSAP